VSITPSQLGYPGSKNFDLGRKKSWLKRLWLGLRIGGDNPSCASPCPGIFSGRALVSHGPSKARPPAKCSARGHERHGRTVGLDIPCPVASPAVFDPEAPFGLPSAMSSGRMELTAEGRPEGSLTPFLQAREFYHRNFSLVKAHGTPEGCLENPRGFGEAIPRRSKREGKGKERPRNADTCHQITFWATF